MDTNAGGAALALIGFGEAVVLALSVKEVRSKVLLEATKASMFLGDRGQGSEMLNRGRC